jgi:hypothetical protein
MNISIWMKRDMKFKESDLTTVVMQSLHRELAAVNSAERQS